MGLFGSGGLFGKGKGVTVTPSAPDGTVPVKVTLPATAIHPKVKAAGLMAIAVTAAGALLQAFGPAMPPWLYLMAGALLPVLAGYVKSS